VSSYTFSRWQQVSKVIYHPGVGDCCPTALMNTMLALLPDEVQAVYFWAYFWKG